MTNEGLFQASVPVFLHYLERIDTIVAGLGADGQNAINSRLAPDTFTAGEQFGVSQGFVSRTVYPLMAQEPVPFITGDTDIAGLRQRNNQLMEMLKRLTPADFRIGQGQRIAHTAGLAELDQTPTDFVTLYALPNFFFHYTMGYAILRQCGLPLGKTDFDGLHFYPPGFSFPD